jgi:hypothetical protein
MNMYTEIVYKPIVCTSLFIKRLRRVSAFVLGYLSGALGVLLTRHIYLCMGGVTLCKSIFYTTLPFFFPFKGKLPS